MSLGSIIREKREEAKLTLDQLSEKTGYSKPYLSTIENDKIKNPPSDELLVKLEKILDFESGFLLHIAHMQRLPHEIRMGYENAENENRQWRQILKNLVHEKNNPEMIKRILDKSEITEESEKKSFSAGKLIPVINKVSAGYPEDFNDLDYPVGIADDYIRCPGINDPNAFAVRVVGDSMEEKFHEGEIVIFSPAKQVNNGDDCFVRFKSPHQTSFKRVFFEKDGKVRLQPRNEEYSPIIVKGEKINGIYKAVAKYQEL